jgi:hypothetical protein
MKRLQEAAAALYGPKEIMALKIMTLKNNGNKKSIQIRRLPCDS